MIADGRIAIDGQKVETPATLLASLKGVTVDGKPVRAAQSTRLFRFYKPQRTITAAHDPKGRSTIYDKLPQGLPRVMPVGRLDFLTEGLLNFVIAFGSIFMMVPSVTQTKRPWRKDGWFNEREDGEAK